MSWFDEFSPVHWWIDGSDSSDWHWILMTHWAELTSDDGQDGLRTPDGPTDLRQPTTCWIKYSLKSERLSPTDCCSSVLLLLLLSYFFKTVSEHLLHIFQLSLQCSMRRFHSYHENVCLAVRNQFDVFNFRRGFGFGIQCPLSRIHATSTWSIPPLGIPPQTTSTQGWSGKPLVVLRGPKGCI